MLSLQWYLIISSYDTDINTYGTNVLPNVSVLIIIVSNYFQQELTLSNVRKGLYAGTKKRQ